jgi:DNA-binding transcriptional MerR regulator
MAVEQRQLHSDEAAKATGIDIAIVRHYADMGLIMPSPEGYSEDELAELRRVRRLREELGLDHPAIEIVLRMRRRIQFLQAEVRRLELTIRTRGSARGQHEWVDAEWDDLP